MKLIGCKHNELLDWLADKWWPQGPPVCLVEGFPGVGKTQMAEALEQRLRDDHRASRIVFAVCPPSGVGILDDLILTLAEDFAVQGQCWSRRRYITRHNRHVLQAR